MPDEISHLLWTYLALKHPSVKNKPDFKTARGKLAMYFFSMLPDLGNLIMLLILMTVLESQGLPLVMGPDAVHNPQVQALVMGPLRNIYYVFHSFISYFVLVALSYFIMRRIYWPLALGMGMHLTLDLLTHADLYAIEPLYPLIDVKVNGFLQWGSWTFYLIEAAIFLVYTIWLFRRTHRTAEPKSNVM